MRQKSGDRHSTFISFPFLRPLSPSALPGITDQLVDAVSLLRERAEKEEPNSLFSLVNDLSKVLCKKISSENLWSLVLYLQEGLVDYQGHSSNGACVVLNNIVKLRGSALSDQVCVHVC